MIINENDCLKDFSRVEANIQTQGITDGNVLLADSQRVADVLRALCVPDDQIEVAVQKVSSIFFVSLEGVHTLVFHAVGNFTNLTITPENPLRVERINRILSLSAVSVASSPGCTIYNCGGSAVRHCNPPE
jgi:hypothetical protein